MHLQLHGPHCWVEVKESSLQRKMEVGVRDGGGGRVREGRDGGGGRVWEGMVGVVG